MTKLKQPKAAGGDPRPYRERRMKFFTCKGTRHTGDAKSQTLKKRFAEAQLCRTCRKGVDINPNQLSLLVDPANPAGDECGKCGGRHAPEDERYCQDGQKRKSL